MKNVFDSVQNKFGFKEKWYKILFEWVWNWFQMEMVSLLNGLLPWCNYFP